MRATSAVLAEIAERRTGTTLLARVHQVDREVADARTQYAALVRPLAVLPRRAGPEGEVRDLMALAHHVHVLAAEALQDPGIAASDGAPASAACTARRLEDLADRFSDDGPAASAAPPEERRTTATADDADPLVREIAHIDSLVGRLARSGR
jgi:hypothetical protein